VPTAGGAEAVAGETGRPASGRPDATSCTAWGAVCMLPGGVRPGEDPADPATGVRKLSIPLYIGIVVVYLVIIQVVGRLATEGLDDAEFLQFRTNEQVALALLLPVGLSLVFVYAVVAVLGWWRPVFIDRTPVQRWVWVVPVVFAVCILLAVNYPGLADKSGGFVVLLLLGALFVGFAEEGMYRGIGVTAFRVNGFSEGRVALWTSVIFGASHLTNVVSTGTGAIAQAVIVTFAGYFFYLTRRVSGMLVLGAVLHGLFDFSIVSGSVGDDELYAGSAAAILAYIVLAVILLVRRRRIELPPSADAERHEPTPAPG
jgi:CAAX protease family protein